MKTVVVIMILLMVSSTASANPWPVPLFGQQGYVGAGGNYGDIMQGPPFVGGYEIDPGGSITLAGGFISGMYYPTYDHAGGGWFIDNVSIMSFGQGGGFNSSSVNVNGPILSYDYLITDLGLAPGRHTVTLYVDVFRMDFQTAQGVYWSGSDTSSLTITPEPATMALLALGGLMLRRKK